MSALLEKPPAVAPLLQFSCGHCGIVLSVPAARAGIRGPCPSCRQLIEAPWPARPAGPPATPRPGQVRVLPRVNASASARQSSAPAPPSSVRKAPPPAEESPAPACAKEDAPAAWRLWSWAAVGSVVGGGLVFAGLSAAQLRRDVSPAPPPAVAARTAAAIAADERDAVAALIEHQRESTRDLNSLLAAQQTIWQFFAAGSAPEARRLLDTPAAPTLPPEGLPSALERITLRTKRRLPGQAGLASQWTVTTSRFGELTVEISEASGQPRLTWEKLAPQLGAPPDTRTAATP